MSDWNSTTLIWKKFCTIFFLLSNTSHFVYNISTLIWGTLKSQVTDLINGITLSNLLILNVKSMLMNSLVQSQFQFRMSLRFKYILDLTQNNFVGQVPIDLGNLLNVQIPSVGAKSLNFLLCRLVFEAVVYNLWYTRNELKHVGSPSSEEQILKNVMWEVQIGWKKKFH